MFNLLFERTHALELAVSGSEIVFVFGHGFRRGHKLAFNGFH